MPTETGDEDFSRFSHGWWVFYGVFRATGQSAFLFNVKADTKYGAIRKGQGFYNGLPFDSPIRRLYSIDECTARPLNREQAELLESKEQGK
jgi:hypothetical protein